MSKLEDLIQRLCPNGVEWKELGEILTNGSAESSIQKKDYKKYGKYPVIDQSQNYIAGYTDNKSAIPPTIPCIIFGDHTRVVKYANIKFAQGDSGTKIFIVKNALINIKYVYYTFSNINITSRGYNRHWSIVKQIKIPIPPLEIQEEIVHILDSFTELTNELTNELTARRKQYEFYRDSLLFDLDNENKMTEINDVIDKVNNINWKTIPDFNNYQYIDLSSVDIKNKLINNTTTISVDNHPSRAQQEVKTNDVIFGTTRPTQMRIAMVSPELNNQVCSTGYCVLRANTKKVLPKWIYYNLSTNRFHTYVEKFQQGASYPAISDTLIKKYTISVPSLDIQNKIIDVLDKFESLCNDITKGLPAEIEARKKQYEYYRDKLLTFKDISENK